MTLQGERRTMPPADREQQVISVEIVCVLGHARCSDLVYVWSGCRAAGQSGVGQASRQHQVDAR